MPLFLQFLPALLRPLLSPQRQRHRHIPSLLPRPSPHAPRHVLLLLLLLPSAFCLQALAQQAPTSLRVSDVRFSQERSPYGGEDWMEMVVQLDVRGSLSPNREFLDTVAAEVALVHNVGSPSKPILEYFWTRIEIPTLKRGIHRTRFYLSPEQVERGRMINNEPYAWYVRVSYGGKTTHPEEAMHTVLAVSAALRDQARLDRFLELLEEQKEDRAGLLLPQAETPFRDAYADDTPTIKGSDRSK